MQALHTVSVKSVVRRLPGSSNAILVKANNEHYYVVKPLHNTEQVTVAVSEWLIAEMLHMFGIATPNVTSMALPANNPCRNNGLLVAESPQCWSHFASQVPVNPETNTIFDFLPKPILPTVANIDDFWKIAVIDAMTHKRGLRQSIFLRLGESRTLRVFFIDHKCPLFALPPQALCDFEADLAMRLSIAGTPAAANIPALLDEFCTRLRESCWMKFLEHSRPLPEAWQEHVSESAVHSAVSNVWKRFRNLQMRSVFDRLRESRRPQCQIK